jgi:hypothetical protein
LTPRILKKKITENRQMSESKASTATESQSAPYPDCS